MTGPSPDPIYRARRTVAVAVLLGVGLLVGALVALLESGGTQRIPTTPVAGPPALSTPTATTPIVHTRRFEQAKAVEQIRRRMPYVAVAGRGERQIALTFDDGPGPYTLRVLKVLDRLQVPATFFQVGQAVKVFSDAEEAEIRDPKFVLANHTWRHANLTTLSGKEQAEQLDWASFQIRQAGGELPQLFRPPYGAFNETTLRLAADRHLLPVLWDVDSKDYERPGTKVIVKNVVDAVHPGSIVLMHDAGGDRAQTIAALPAIIKRLRAKHYRFVTVPRLLHDSPPPIRQPKVEVGVG